MGPPRFFLRVFLGVREERKRKVSRGKKGKGRRENRGFNLAFVWEFNIDKEEEVESL